MKALLRILAALAFLLAGQNASPASSPNVLIIVADDLGSADVGFNGGKLIPTPSLDQLAASGIKLTDFRAAPVCSPTRAGLLTGRWPLRFGIMRAVLPPWSEHGLPEAENTLPELLAGLGYERRGMTGKWHLGHSKRAHLPLAHGFTSFYGCYNGAIDYFTHIREGELDWHRNDAPARDEGYSTDLIGDEAARFIKEAPANKPWFHYCAFNAPHAPFQAKESDLKKYPQLKMPDRRAYAAMVDCMDQAIGRILGAVEARDDAANTVILFFSDNGGVAKVGSNAPNRGAKANVYEGGTRVCAAIRWPAGGLTGGKQFDGRIGYIDVLPTVVAACQGGAPANVDGINFLPALRGEAAVPTRPWFSYIHQDEEAHASVHLENWKLVAHGDSFSAEPAAKPRLELYDLATDRSEAADVASLHPEKVVELHRLLREFGTWQQPGAGPYAAGRKGFVAPKEWLVTE